MLSTARVKFTKAKLASFVHGRFMETHSACVPDSTTERSGPHLSSSRSTSRAQLSDAALARRQFLSQLMLPDNAFYEPKYLFGLSSAAFGRFNVSYYTATDTGQIRRYPVCPIELLCK